MGRRFTAKPHLPANHRGFRLPAANRPCVRSLSHRRARARLVLNAPAHRPWQASLRSPFPRTPRRARFVSQRSTSTSLSSVRPGRRARGRPELARPVRVAAMGQCLSWALGLLLPSLWEAEVAVSATALLIAALVLFLLTSDQHTAKPTAAGGGGSSLAASSSSRPSAAAACRCDAGRGRSGARGEAVSEISCAPGAGGYVIKVTAATSLSTAQQRHPSAALIDVPIAFAPARLLFLTCSSVGCQLELLSAKYLIGANLDGSSDPFAVISCSEQKRFRCVAVAPSSSIFCIFV
jgi:hypothetical protein